MNGYPEGVGPCPTCDGAGGFGDRGTCGDCEGSGTTADPRQPDTLRDAAALAREAAIVAARPDAALRTFEFTAARDGDTFSEDFIAPDEETAEEMAVARINEAWGQSYDDYQDMMADSDGCDMIEHPAVMADRLPLAAVEAYRRLADGLSDMVEGGRITAADCPDDFAWLVAQLVAIVAHDPGAPRPPRYMETL